MAINELLTQPVRRTAAQIRSGDVTPTHLVELVLQRIEATDGAVKAYTHVRADRALVDARRAERELEQGLDRGPLHGLPISVKDLIDVGGEPTTYGSSIFEGHLPQEDANVVRRLKDAGAVIVGKTNTHEFALGGITPPTRNPFDLERIPGGSSGGSAAAIAAGSALLAIGSDTGGSIRIPSSFCGVAGLKPTYGLVSRTGVFPESWSLDHVGPIARHVEDAALLLSAIAGHDPRDHTTAKTPVPDYAAALDHGADGLRVGVPTNHFFDDLSGDVSSAVRAAIDHLAASGLRVEEVVIPSIDEILGAYWALDLAEIAANHRRLYVDHVHDYLPDTRLLIECGFFVESTTYIDARRMRPHLLATVLDAIDDVDVLALPAQPMVAPHVGATLAAIDDHSEDLLLAMIRLDAPFNLLGLPALSVCCGYDPTGLPIGLQIVGKPYEEAYVLRVAHAYQTSTPWRERLLTPPM
jgi:aspartyl-tRNA(Asn)/glutamyl-tRNA(Gln) amidotransferase subunit A